MLENGSDLTFDTTDKQCGLDANAVLTASYVTAELLVGTDTHIGKANRHFGGYVGASLQ